MSRLEVSHIKFRHSPTGPWILQDFSLSLESETAIIIGDNGSGKSTLGRLIAGLTRPDDGNVKIDEREVRSIPVAQRPVHVAYMGQTSYLQFFRSSIAEEISYAARIAGRTQEEIRAAYFRYRLPEDQSLKPMDLSYPAMWRFQLFLFANVFRPTVLFVDEIVAPGSKAQMEALTAALDERSSRHQTTILAYQRMISVPGIRRFDLIQGALH